MFVQFPDTPLLRTIFGQKSASFLEHWTDFDRFSSEAGTTSAESSLGHPSAGRLIGTQKNDKEPGGHQLVMRVPIRVTGRVLSSVE